MLFRSKRNIVIGAEKKRELERIVHLHTMALRSRICGVSRLRLREKEKERRRKMGIMREKEREK